MRSAPSASASYSRVREIAMRITMAASGAWVGPACAMKTVIPAIQTAAAYA